MLVRLVEELVGVIEAVHWVHWVALVHGFGFGVFVELGGLGVAWAEDW